jgi:hypothetical protein
MKRYTARIRTDYQAKEYLKIGMNAGYTNFNWNNGNSDEGSAGSVGNIFGFATMVAPIYPVYLRNADKSIKIDEHGYKRFDNYYKAVSPNEDTIVLFCHFGLECVLLSHLLGISPMVLWHGFCAAPTSVTTVVTEERVKGKAYFRVSAFGDTSHLYAVGEKPSFSARFCETYDNFEQRHD